MSNTKHTMSHTQKLWYLVGILVALWVLIFLILKPMHVMAQGYERLNPNIYGPNPEQYRGRGFERDYQDYARPGFRNWAPEPRQTYRPPPTPYQGRPYIGHWPSYGGYGR